MFKNLGLGMVACFAVNVQCTSAAIMLNPSMASSADRDLNNQRMFEEWVCSDTWAGGMLWWTSIWVQGHQVIVHKHYVLPVQIGNKSKSQDIDLLIAFEMSLRDAGPNAVAVTIHASLQQPYTWSRKTCFRMDTINLTVPWISDNWPVVLQVKNEGW